MHIFFDNCKLRKRIVRSVICTSCESGALAAHDVRVQAVGMEYSTFCGQCLEIPMVW